MIIEIENIVHICSYPESSSNAGKVNAVEIGKVEFFS